MALTEESSPATKPVSPLAPFRSSSFTVLWSAALISNIGTWMYKTKRELFLAALEELSRERRRDGAYAWGIFEDTAAAGRFIETMSSPGSLICASMSA